VGGGGGAGAGRGPRRTDRFNEISNIGMFTEREKDKKKKKTKAGVGDQEVCEVKA